MIDFNRNSSLLSVVVILVLLNRANLDRITTKIYKSLEDKHNCLRRLNDTNQIGCNTKESGNVGIIYIVNRDNDLDYVLEYGEHYPYVPVITAKYFNFQTLYKMKCRSGRISGVILVDRDVSQLSSTQHYSPDKSCPNDNFDLYVNNDSYSHCKKQKWNSDNDRINENLMFNDWPFPIFLIRNETNITQLENCFNKYNKEWPLCAVQMISSSYGAKDAKTCRRRSFLRSTPITFLHEIEFCRPFEAHNMFSILLTTTKNVSLNEKSVVVLSARLDSFSMFSDISPGADSVITSLVTFLSIVHTLNKSPIKDLIKEKAQNKNILYALFDGQAFDYIGSSRAVYDISRGHFPLSSDSIMDMAEIRTKHFSHFIELNQLALKGKDSQNQKLYIHKNIESNIGITQLQNIFQKNTNGSGIQFEGISDGAPLPPSSLQSFLKDDNSLIGVVIANHQKEYTNRFYNSFYDDFKQLNVSESNLAKSLTNIATVVSKSIVDLLLNSSDQSLLNETDGLNITADEELMKSLIKCYLINTNCSLFNTVFQSKDNPNITFETYVGSIKHSKFRRYTYMLLSYFNSEVVPVNTTKECVDKESQDKRFDYDWIPGPTFQGMCIRSHSVLSERTSPAFDNYTRTGTFNSLYSTWTESNSKSTLVRIFLKPSRSQEWLTLGAGITILIMSIIILVVFKSFAKQLFNLPDVESSLSTIKETEKGSESE